MVRGDIERYNTSLHALISSQVAQRQAKLLADRNLEAGIGSEARSVLRSLHGLRGTPEIDALSGLQYLDQKPDWDRERRIWAGKDPGELGADEQASVDAWTERRREFLRAIEVAIFDISDAALRARLEEAVRMLELW